MVDITFKSNTHRIAIAQAVVKVSQQQTIDAVINKTVPKGDVFEMAKTAGLFAVKRTSDLIPDCHPIPIEFTAIRYKVEGLEIKIKVEIQTIYKTGVEVEAMHGASVVALTMYDMLKPIDKGIEIHSIKLLEKSGGKTDYKDKFEKPLTASVVVCSDTIAAGKKVDKAGKAIIKKLEKYNVRILDYAVISDDVKALHDKGIQLLTTNCDILIFTGGTGVSPRDNTPDVIKSLMDKEIPGIMETARNYGQNRMPYSMLSRGIAGMKGNTLILTLPGSTRGAEETMDALFPQVLHVFPMIKGGQH